LEILHIKVKEKFRENFSCIGDRNSIGILDSEDKEHVWIKPFKKNLNKESFIGSLVRYPKHMIDYEVISNV